MRAIISDIHGNLEGLEAVLADITAQGIREVYCLGDIVGYGPNPRECIDLVMNCPVCLLGNHDQAALFDPEGFNAGAERAIFWTRKMLESGDTKGNERRWEFLGELPRMRREEEILFVHGSARNPLNEYIFPEDIYNQRKMERIFGLVERYCFQGHTHIPGVFTENLNFLVPDEIEYEYTLGDEKAMINVGSVGQPRDGNPRACYVILNGSSECGGEAGAESAGSEQGLYGHGTEAQFRRVESSGGDETDSGGASGQPSGFPTAPFGRGTKVRFRRVEYDFEKTAEKIYSIPELDNFLGDRLRDGR